MLLVSISCVLWYFISSLLTILKISTGDNNINRLNCPTCPYEFPIAGVQIFDRKELPRKQVDDVLGGEGAWDNVDQTTAQCPIDSCGNDKAYFFQLQIRSADEPMTTFYKVSYSLLLFFFLLLFGSGLLTFLFSVPVVVINGEKIDQNINSCK